MKERKLGLAKRLSAMALALVMVFSLLSLSDLKALAAGDTAPTLAEDWTYDGKDHDLIVAPGQAIDPAYTLLYAVTETDREPNAPTPSNLGEWTINWRDDDYFLVADAGEYYVWWCAYDADEDEFSTEPECAGLVEVEKATPLGYAPTGATVEWTGDPVNIVEKVGGIPFDVDNSQYLYAITDAEEDDPTNYSWKTFAQGGTYESEVGEYKVWYKLDYIGNDTKNYEDGEVSYVEAEITAKALVVTNDEQDADYKGSGTAPQFADLTFTKSDGSALTNQPNVTYAVNKKDLTKAGAHTYPTLQAAFNAAATTETAPAKNYKAGTYKIYYTASLEGYETVTDEAVLTVNKAQIKDGEDTTTTYQEPTFIGATALATTESQIRLITNAGDVASSLAGDAAWYFQVNSSGKIPSTNSLSGWTKADQYTTVTKGEGKWYVFYMVASKDNPSIAPSDVKYKTVTVAKNGTTIADQGDPNTSALNPEYNAEAQPIITKATNARTGATVQYYVGENDETMPAANASGWITLGSSEELKRIKAGEYTVWTRILQYTDSTNQEVYAETTPVPVSSKITPKTPAVINNGVGDYTDPTAAQSPLTYSGRSQYLLEEGKANNGLYWLYLTEKYDAATDKWNLVNFGTTAPKMTDVGTYRVGAVLIDSSAVIDEDGNCISNYQFNGTGSAYVVEKFGMKFAVVGFWRFNPNTFVTTEVVAVQQKPAEVTDPELVDEDLEYTGEAQSFIAKAGKTTSGSLYYLVEDDKGQIVSIDGTATEASDYTVYTMVTEMSAFEVAMLVAQGNIAAPYLKALGQAIQTPMDYVEAYGFAGSNIWAEPTSQGNVTIEQAEPTVIGVKPITTEYTGYMQDLAEEGITDGGRIYYMAYDESGDEVWDEWTRIVPQAEDMGKYTIAYKVEIPEWDTDSNFTALDEVTLDEKAYIAAGVAKVTTAPVGLGLNANGQEQALVTEGVAQDGKMVYALGTVLEPTSEWSETIPTASAEGEYHVWYKAQATEAEYADSKAQVTTANIGHVEELYRIFNPATGEHIYTYDANEVATLTAPGGGWSYEGTVSGTSAGTIPVYRLENLMNPGVHIYSKDQNEIDTLVALGVAKYEGVQFMTVPQGEGTQDYYRLSSPSFPHHYTADQNEINSLIASGVYTLDGYAWSFPQ